MAIAYWKKYLPRLWRAVPLAVLIAVMPPPCDAVSFTGQGLKGISALEPSSSPDVSSTPFFGSIGDYLKSLFNPEALPSSMYLLDEYLFNGGDRQALTGHINPGTATTELLSDRKLVGTSFEYWFSKLFRFEGTALFTPDKNRFFVSPLLKYSLNDELDVAAGMQVFSTGEEEEWGALPNMYFAELKVLF